MPPQVLLIASLLLLRGVFMGEWAVSLSTFSCSVREIVIDDSLAISMSPVQTKIGPLSRMLAPQIFFFCC